MPSGDTSVRSRLLPDAFGDVGPGSGVRGVQREEVGQLVGGVGGDGGEGRVGRQWRGGCACGGVGDGCW